MSVQKGTNTGDLIKLLHFAEGCGILSSNRKMVLVTESWTVELVGLLVGVFSIFYLFAKRKYSYWDRKGFKSLPEPSFLFGHFRQTFTQREGLGEFLTRIYKNSTEPILGIYSIFRPILLVRNPEIVRTILVKDFQYFTDRE